MTKPATKKPTIKELAAAAGMSLARYRASKEQERLAFLTKFNSEFATGQFEGAGSENNLNARW